MAREGIRVEELRRLLDYDPITGVMSWRLVPGRDVGSHEGRAVGYVHDGRYRKVEISRHRYMVHRVIWVWMTGDWPKEQIDHINGVKDDNRWCNLREATNAQNQQNRPGRSSKTGVKGVHRSLAGKAYWASICANGQSVYLGCFTTKEEASGAYQRAALQFHGEFAWTKAAGGK